MLLCYFVFFSFMLFFYKKKRNSADVFAFKIALI